MLLKKRGISVMAGILAALLLAGSVRVNAASSDEILEQIRQLEEQEAQLQEQMDELEEKLADNLEQMEQMVAQKDTIDRQISVLNDQITNTSNQITAYALLVADKQDALDAAQEELESLRRKFKARIRVMEEEGTLSYWEVLFRSSSFADFLDRVNMIQEIAEADQRRLQEISAAAESVELAQNALQEDKTALEQIRQQLWENQARLEEKRREADALLQELMARETEFEALLEQSEEMQDALMEELAQKEDEYDEALYQEWLDSYVPPVTQPGDQTPSPEIPESSEDWITPVPYYTLTSAFGMRLHPILGIYRMHNGVDLACDAMTPIYASRGGLVEVAGYQEGGAGNYVQLNHGDGFRSIYMHMTYDIVSQGQYVAPGQVIGYVGNTGLSKGNHLHFGISYNGEYVNPMEYIG